MIAPMPTLHFKGKQLIQNHHLVVPFHELKPVKAKSVLAKGASVSLHDNVIMHGDNLAALKALLPTHQGKIKCIYIDPPYNTGNEGWVYNDNVNDPMLKEWLGNAVDKEDLTRHDKWLCMMWPRLKLLRDLLAEDGSIWISIDDNEVHRLRSVCDDIFGEENFVGEIAWFKKASPSNDAKYFSYDHEYIIVYAKNKSVWKPNRLERNSNQLSYYKNPDNDPRGVWNSATYTCSKSKSERPNLYYPIINPNTGEKIWPKETAVWAYDEAATKQYVAEKKLYWGADGKAKFPRFKLFLDEAKNVVPRTIWLYDDVGHTQGATIEIQTIFPDKKDIFSTPKPTTLIKKIIQIACDSNDIILDSFAGSGTTAHAVLSLNKEDGGNRKFILIETLDYADTITAERVRRVIKGVPQARDEALKEGLVGTFSYFELGKPVEIQTILNGKNLPDFNELARYVFFMATGEEWNDKQLDKAKNYIGESRNYHVYLFYDPSIDYLKNTALTLPHAEAMPKWKQGDKRRLVFAPTKYLDQDYLERFGIDFARLPYEIYQLAGDKQKAGG